MASPLAIPMDGATFDSDFIEEKFQRGAVGRGIGGKSLAYGFGGSDLANFTKVAEANANAIEETAGVLHIDHKDNINTTYLTGTGPGIRHACPAGPFEVIAKIASKVMDTNHEQIALFFRNDLGTLNTGVTTGFLSSSGNKVTFVGYVTSTPNPNVSASFSPSLPFFIRLARDKGGVITGSRKQNLGDVWTPILAATSRTQYNGAGYIDLTLHSAHSSPSGLDVTIDSIEGIFYSKAADVATLAAYSGSGDLDPSTAEIVMHDFVQNTSFADTDTEIKMAYRTDGGDWSGWLTANGYKGVGTITFTTSLQFRFQLNSSGVQELAAFFTSAGDLEPAVMDAPTPAVIGTVTKSGLVITVPLTGDAGVTNYVDLHSWPAGAEIDTDSVVGDGNTTVTADVEPGIYELIPYSSNAGGFSRPGTPVRISLGPAGEPREPSILALYRHLEDQGLSVAMRTPGVAFDTSIAEWVEIYIMRADKTPSRIGSRFDKIIVVAEAIVRKSTDFMRHQEIADEVEGLLKNVLITFSVDNTDYGMRLFEPARMATLAPEEAGEDALAERIEIAGTLEQSL